MRIALDTNFVAYAEGLDDDVRGARASAVIGLLARHELVMPVQVCAEVVQLVGRKFRRGTEAAIVILRRWQRICPIRPESSSAVLAVALDLAV